MAASPYASERLMAALDGAQLCRYDTAGLLYVWYGSHGVAVLDATGQEVDYWSVGDFSQNAATLEEVEESIARRLLNLDEIIERAEQEGYDRGRAAGSWVLDGNSTRGRRSSAPRRDRGRRPGDHGRVAVRRLSRRVGGRSPASRRARLVRPGRAARRRRRDPERVRGRLLAGRARTRRSAALGRCSAR